MATFLAARVKGPFEESFEGLGPTLMAEHLVKAKLVVDPETLWRWRMATGQYTARRRKQKHRQPEPIKAHPEAWRCIGQKVSEPLDYEPARFLRRRTIRKKYVHRTGNGAGRSSWYGSHFPFRPSSLAV